MLECNICGKIYKRSTAYKKHVILCEIPDKDMKKGCILPSKREMWYILQKLIKQNKTQQHKIETLERVVNKDIKKVNILEWLNANIKLSTDINKWLKDELKVSIEDIQYIFDTTFTRGLYRIIDNSINVKTSPFKAFSHKSKQLYVYENSKWKKATNNDIREIFSKIQLEIMKTNRDYENNLSDIKKFGPNNLAYLKNGQKIMIVNPKVKDRCLKYTQNTIIDLVKVNLNDMAKYQFYI